MVHGFVEKIGGTGLQCLVHNGFLFNNGDDDNRDIGAIRQLPHATGKFNAIEFRHFVINGNEIRWVGCGDFQCGKGTVKALDLDVIADAAT